MDSERLKDHLMLSVLEFNKQEVPNQPDVGHIFGFYSFKSTFSLRAEKAQRASELWIIFKVFPRAKLSALGTNQ